MKNCSAAGLFFLSGLCALAQTSEDAPPPKVVPVQAPVQAPAPVPTNTSAAPEIELRTVPKVIPVNPPAPQEAAPSVPPKTAPSRPADQEAPPNFRGDSSRKLELPVKPQPQGPLPAPTPASTAPTPAPVASTPLPSNVGPEQRQLGLADFYYAQQQWDLAVTEYQRFLSEFPRSNQTAPALYRLAEACMKLGNNNSARLYYDKLLALPRPGPEGGVAAYRLAEFERQERDFAAAEAHYKLAAQLIADQNVKISARYFSARCLQEMNRKAEARVVYQTLADTAEAHPFKEVSQFQAALLGVEAGRLVESLPRFEKLAAEAANPEIRAEAKTRAALTLLELPNPQKALAALETAVALPETAKWHGVLRLGILKASAALGDSQKIIATYRDTESSLDPAQLPEVLLLVGNAHRDLKQHAEAAAAYSKLLDITSDPTLAANARYERLACY
ncbi:MAG: hypothetical protein EBS01_07960, partial [Verrucomicrobia bacterium]|nr:hypothetical protein [Verrucomicrobiota bacterium]